jgi:hypothetical protein
MFRLFVPAEFGGYEVSPIIFTRIIEEIAAIDRATAWVVSVCAVGGLFAGYLEQSVARQIYGTDPDAIIAGGINPSPRQGWWLHCCRAVGIWERHSALNLGLPKLCRSAK